MTYPSTGEVQVGSILRETYEIVALLGYGGMGSVYSARHLRLPGKQVAVKVLHARSGLSPEIFKRFRREAEIASRLGHPNIVEVLDFDQLASGTPFLVLELLRGESLAQRLHKGRLTWEETQPMVRQVGSALRAAHRAGVVHRDLKPDNIFLMPSEAGGVVSERVKLLDFGISKFTSEPSTVQTLDAILMGTPLYMSPEQALGKNSEVDARTDIFALGSILYEALTGRSPFEGENIPQIIYRIVHEEPPPLGSLVPDLPPKALAAIERALAKSPDARYPDVGSFIAELTGSPLQTLADPKDAPPPAAGEPATEDADLESTFISQARQRSPSEAPPARAIEPIAAGAPGAAAAPVPAAPIATPSPPAHASRGRLVAIVLGLGLAGGVGWGLLSRLAPAGRGETLAPVSPPVVVAPAPVVIDVPVASGPGVTVTAPVPVEPPEIIPPTPPRIASPPPLEVHRRERGRLSPAVRDLLVQAEKELLAGNAQKAIELALRSERVAGPSESEREATFRLSNHIRVRAYCLLGNLSDARPIFLDLPREARAGVRLYCKQHNVELSQ